MKRYDKHAGSYLGYYYKSGLHLRMDYRSYRAYIEKIIEISLQEEER
ncbi:hypothetical protein [Streptococcus himalayensis]|uniref:Uncharacterized protein n=1 Tax=Streptococcus himalayensis TaxID=1888195 RepID=A0A917EI08_9STRE|nr:hypothetical protein [Streptococcus himalayensis]GGE37340.1 hypothetical protein GCM10011510_18310 [Streptococcus himalayensis]